MLLSAVMKNQHHGEILERAVRQSGVSISKIAQKIGYTRAHIYNLFHQKTLDLNLILAVGEAIHYDFSDTVSALKTHKNVQYAEYTPHIAAEPQPIYESSARQLEQKYTKLLEDYAAVLKENSQLYKEMRRMKK